MVAAIRYLPPISKAALELTRLLGERGASNEGVVRVLRQDAVLTARLLRACNSPAQGLREPVASVEQAVLLLGYEQISQFVIALALRGSLSRPLGAYGLQSEGLWRHSVLSATAAELAVREGAELGIEPAVAFTAGLLHDIGKLVTNEFVTREGLVRARELVLEGVPFVEAEREVLGADHAEVGAALAYLWHLPEILVEAIALHHKPVLQPRPRLSAFAAVGNVLAHRAEHGSVPTDAGPEKELLAVLGFIPEQVHGLLARLAQGLKLDGCMALEV